MAVATLYFANFGVTRTGFTKHKLLNKLTLATGDAASIITKSFHTVQIWI